MKISELAGSKAVSVDLDGVLNYYPDCWVDFLNKEADSSFKNKEEALQRLGRQKYDHLKDKYRKSDFKANLKVRSDAVHFLRSLKDKGYFVIVATSRPFLDPRYPQLRLMTKEWLRKNSIPHDLLVSKSELTELHSILHFHIDDEEEHARQMAINGIRVFLLDNKKDVKYDNITRVAALTDILRHLDEPLFSVCVETYNRGKTIFETLTSVRNQTFQDFEVVVVDNKSTDNTVKEIERFFASDLYTARPFPYVFRQNPVHLKGVRNWNEPLKLANGKYIAVLEGDDQYLPSHLEEAQKILKGKDNIGIYATGNQNALRPILGLINSRAYFAFTYLLKNVSAPSETIFIRRNPEKQFFFNVDKYSYCPEVALYLEIASDGFNAYHNENQMVIRRPSSHESSWVRFIDYYKIIMRYKSYVPRKTYHQSLIFNTQRMIKYFLVLPRRIVEYRSRASLKR